MIIMKHQFLIHAHFAGNTGHRQRKFLASKLEKSMQKNTDLLHKHISAFVMLSTNIMAFRFSS